jgi:hypothetical protein
VTTALIGTNRALDLPRELHIFARPRNSRKGAHLNGVESLRELENEFRTGSLVSILYVVGTCEGSRYR